MNRRTFMALGAATGSLFVGGAAAHAAPDVTVPAAGLALVGGPVRLGARLVELTLSSDALGSTTKVRVLLPEGYDRESRRRYPVVYLFHGGLEDHTAWSAPERGNAEELTAGLSAIVVMPDGGPYGFYVDWFNGGAFGTPMWETYHMQELVPWIDANYRTIQGRSARATAGLSMGGHGALAYAARHPDLIGVSAAFSGSIDITNHRLAVHAPEQLPLTEILFGTYARQEVRWRGKNTWDLAANLAHTHVSLYTGDTGETEVGINECTRAVHHRLDELGISHRYTLHSGMSHDWANFRKSFADWLPHLTRAFTRGPAPGAFTLTSVEPQYGHTDWSVRMTRDVAEFSALEVYGRHHFTVIGNGSATVATPAFGRPRARYEVIVEGATGRSSRRITADRDGRLTIPLVLGPGNPYQQYSPEADAASTGPSQDVVPFHVRGNASRFHRTEVRIRPSGGNA